jgi:hypothetical protein
MEESHSLTASLIGGAACYLSMPVTQLDGPEASAEDLDARCQPNKTWQRFIVDVKQISS